MKVLLIRTIAIEEDLSQNTYNNQGVGLAKALIAMGHTCDLVYYAKRGRAREETIPLEGDRNIHVYHVSGLNIAWEAIYGKRLWQICRTYDVLQTSEADQISSWILRLLFPQKTVIYHGPYESLYCRRYNIKAKVLFTLFGNIGKYKETPILSKSRLATEYLQKKKFKNIKTIGVGLDLSKFQTMDTKDMNHFLQNKGQSKYLLYVGKIQERKNLKFLMDVLERVKSEIPCVKLVVVGGKEEAYYQECMEYLKRKSLSDDFIYLGSQDQRNLPDIYTASDVFLLPTHYDIFGMVFLEAMYFGCPVITTENGGSSVLIDSGVNGYIFHEDDLEAWSAAAVSILKKTDGERQTLSDWNKEFIRDNFLWNKLAQKCMDTYTELMIKQ